jgi:cell wall-associated NlpC family hydrolase
MLGENPSWRAGLAALVVAGLSALAPASRAAPESTTPAPAPGDAVLHLLQERGLLPAQVAGETQLLVGRVRDTASDLVLSAMNFLGVPYRRGGSSPEQGFDCSGFTRHIFERSVGLVLPRRADQQANEAGLLDVKRDELKPGDLVFFNTMRRAFSHVGIYVGDGKFIHSPRTGGQVRVEDMREAYWAKRFNGARRAEIDGASVPLNAREPARDPLRNATRP